MSKRTGARHEREFQLLRQLVSALGKALGDRCEVVLHDLSVPESSIVAIEHGDITGRRVGDSSTNLAMAVLKDPYGSHDQYNYRSRTRTGRVLRSSSIYLKDATGRIFASLCLNWDITELEVAVSVLRNMVATEDTVEEHYVRDIDELVRHFVDEALSMVGKPIQAMDKEDKMRVVQWLEQRGVFAVRHSAARVAAILGLSKPTIYAYLNEIQGTRINNMV